MIEVGELKIEHVLLFVIAAFLLYHLMGSCRCRDGFSVGGKVYKPYVSGYYLNEQNKGYGLYCNGMPGWHDVGPCFDILFTEKDEATLYAENWQKEGGVECVDKGDNKRDVCQYYPSQKKCIDFKTMQACPINRCEWNKTVSGGTCLIKPSCVNYNTKEWCDDMSRCRWDGFTCKSGPAPEPGPPPPPPGPIVRCNQNVKPPQICPGGTLCPISGICPPYTGIN